MCGALLCFLLTVVVLRRRAGHEAREAADKGRYELVDAQRSQMKT